MTTAYYKSTKCWLQVFVNNIACRSIALALTTSLAPILCANITAKPPANAEHIPPINHVVVLTKPIDAEAAAPR